MSVLYVIFLLVVDLLLIECDKTDVLNFKRTKVNNDATSDDDRPFSNEYSKQQPTTNKYINDTENKDIVSIPCLRCLCLHATDCLPLKCRHWNSGVACGYFLISQDFYTDCLTPGQDFLSCVYDFNCSSRCIQQYMSRYVDAAQCPHTCESFVRLFHGGPGGCNSPASMPYWINVQQEPGCKGVE